MTQFVWFDTGREVMTPVNPDLVAYLRASPGGVTLIFGAVQGGLHELAVQGTLEEVVARLESDRVTLDLAPGAVNPLPKPPSRPARRKRR